MKQWILLLSMLSSAVAFSSTEPVFRVVKKKGPIFIKQPMGLRWEPLKTEFLEMGTLLRTDPGAKIDLVLQKDRVNVDEKSQSLSVNQPLITRIDDELVRRTELRDYPMRDVWDTGKESKKAPAESPVLAFAASFVRGLAILQKAPALPSVEQNPEEDGIKAGAEVGEIPILSPSHDALFFLEGKQVWIPLVWGPVPNPKKYHVYVWEESEGKHGPLASVAQSWYQLSFEKPGRYLIQISDSGHRYRSKVVPITIDRKLERSQTLANARENPAMDLVYPPAQSVQIDGKKKINFSWIDRDGLGPKQNYRLVIIDKKKPRRVSSKTSSIAVNLEPGNYRWFVEKVEGKKKSSPTVSETRNFELRASSDIGSLLKTAEGGQSILIDLGP